MTGYKPGMLISSIGDAHIYKNHIEQVKEMVSRSSYPLPELEFPEFTTTDTKEQLKEAVSWGVNAYKLIGYNSHSAIRAPMAV